MLPQQQQRQRQRQQQHWQSQQRQRRKKLVFFLSYTPSKSCELTSKPAYDGVAATQRTTTATSTPAYIHFTHRGGKRAWKFAKRVAHEHEHERKAGNRTTGIVNREVIHMRSLCFVSLNVCVYVRVRENGRVSERRRQRQRCYWDCCWRCWGLAVRAHSQEFHRHLV